MPEQHGKCRLHLMEGTVFIIEEIELAAVEIPYPRLIICSNTKELTGPLLELLDCAELRPGQGNLISWLMGTYIQSFTERKLTWLNRATNLLSVPVEHIVVSFIR